MQIFRAGQRASVTPNPDYFTGTVRMDPIVAATAPSRVNAVIVTFEPGARTAWHTHPLGQSLHVLSGLCLAQIEGEPVQELRPGDTVVFPAGVRHWHGAAPDVAMSHLAIQEEVDGSAADWLEKVSDSDYAGPRATLQGGVHPAASQPTATSTMIDAVSNAMPNSSRRVTVSRKNSTEASSEKISSTCPSANT